MLKRIFVYVENFIVYFESHSFQHEKFASLLKHLRLQKRGTGERKGFFKPLYVVPLLSSSTNLDGYADAQIRTHYSSTAASRRQVLLFQKGRIYPVKSLLEEHFQFLKKIVQ